MFDQDEIEKLTKQATEAIEAWREDTEDSEEAKDFVNQLNEIKQKKIEQRKEFLAKQKLKGREKKCTENTKRRLTISKSALTCGKSTCRKLKLLLS